jgi:hypothetical protein
MKDDIKWRGVREKERKIGKEEDEGKGEYE